MMDNQILVYRQLARSAIILGTFLECSRILDTFLGYSGILGTNFGGWGSLICSGTVQIFGYNFNI